MKLKEVFEKSVQFFKDKRLETPRLDAELLIAHALNFERVQLYIKYEQPLKEVEVALCREAIRRRALGEPVAYINGEKGFYGELFKVGPGVLIPRPETEIIVDEALKFLKTHPVENPKILDLGAGSGCIGLSLLKNNTHATLVSLEKSVEAVKYFEINELSLELNYRSKLICADIEDFDFSGMGLFDLIVSNPPYVALNDPKLEINVKNFEPHAALFAEEQGMGLLKSWLKKSAPLLKSGAMLLFEIGSDQREKVISYALDQNIFSNVQIIKDLSGLDRTLKCIR